MAEPKNFGVQRFIITNGRRIEWYCRRGELRPNFGPFESDNRVLILEALIQESVQQSFEYTLDAPEITCDHVVELMRIGKGKNGAGNGIPSLAAIVREYYPGRIVRDPLDDKRLHRVSVQLVAIMQFGRLFVPEVAGKDRKEDGTFWRSMGAGISTVAEDSAPTSNVSDSSWNGELSLQGASNQLIVHSDIPDSVFAGNGANQCR
jgi:hypothetical protein